MTLAISCSPTHYKLGYTTTDHVSEVTWLDSISMQAMTADPPQGMAFTGMMLGLYAFADLEPCLDPADFHYAAWSDGEVE